MNYDAMKTKQSKKVYISGKISGLEYEEVIRNFEHALNELLKSNKFGVVVNPLNIYPFLGRKTWLCYMINDIRAQRKCTHSAFQPNWKESRGAVIEYYFAKFIFKQEILFL